MIIPHFLLSGAEAAQYVGQGKKLVNQMAKAGIRSKTLQGPNGVSIRAEQFGNTGKVRINTGTGNTPIVIQDFDSAIIRYTWFNASGRDLDTVTFIQAPNFTGDSVGWVTRRSYTPSSVSDINTCYLFWNGDNTESVGSEAILVNFKLLIDAYPDLNEFRFLMHGTWYGSKGDGKIKLEFQTYKGGTFDSATEEYNIVNVGGTLVQEFSKDVVVDLQQPGANPGQLVGTLTYSRDTNKFSLV
jgi:hypothetical protein